MDWKIPSGGVFELFYLLINSSFEQPCSVLVVSNPYSMPVKKNTLNICLFKDGSLRTNKKLRKQSENKIPINSGFQCPCSVLAVTNPCRKPEKRQIPKSHLCRWTIGGLNRYPLTVPSSSFIFPSFPLIFAESLFKGVLNQNMTARIIGVHNWEENTRTIEGKIPVDILCLVLDLLSVSGRFSRTKSLKKQNDWKLPINSGLELPYNVFQLCCLVLDLLELWFCEWKFKIWWEMSERLRELGMAVLLLHQDGALQVLPNSLNAVFVPHISFFLILWNEKHFFAVREAIF